MTEQDKRLSSDLERAVKLSLKLSDLNRVVAISRLNYAQEVLAALKGMPKIKPSQHVLRLSEIAPQLQEEAKTEEPSKQKFFSRIKEAIGRIRRQ